MKISQKRLQAIEDSGGKVVHQRDTMTAPAPVPKPVPRETIVSRELLDAIAAQRESTKVMAQAVQTMSMRESGLERMLEKLAEQPAPTDAPRKKVQLDVDVIRNERGFIDRLKITEK